MAVSSNTHNNLRHFQEDHTLPLSELQQYFGHWHVQSALTSINLCYKTCQDPASYYYNESAETFTDF